MARELIVNNKSFQYPDPNEDPGWGGEASDWASEVTDVLNTLLAPGDITLTSFTISNDQSTFMDVSGLLFDAATVRSAIVTYTVYRISTANPSGNAESGEINLVYDNDASMGNKWSFTQQKNGEAGVIFQILDSGQVQYKSTDIDSVGYTGIIKFTAKTIAQ